MPRGDDALDLTRMVEYCVQHPVEGWEYPKDYEKLLGLLGGPQTVTPEHVDRAAFKRWEGVVPLPPRPRPDALTVGRRKNKKSMGSAEDETPAPQPGRKRGMPRKRARLEEDADFAEDDQEVRAAREEIEERINAASDSAAPTYIHGLAHWVAPPSLTEEPSDARIICVFEEEGCLEETDPFSAYAFLGPRDSPPYRPLHRIDHPLTSDISGWAENLRWAAEQTATFRTGGWNESPEHMERIHRIRVEQKWVSMEWLDAYPTIEQSLTRDSDTEPVA
ncbi:hypothetical protein BU26DRAFT_521803 [Trematosphaeria pertusa]|uniref:Uncharacterized protein n=1 Tax=Trematosphaeria pertusa TaxID=390896 RepID=A0A6A6I4P7_9PLEO|nr:uncharacterized protein BU26DRAFT_521803 [Trematosphaeria pertusa]KAF2245321.1 hypothetical protein BU26DRAFT_521803 [Trematosphaeria pertusa]